MKNAKTLRKRGLALFLALVMCFGLLQTTAWAVDDEEPTEGPQAVEPSDTETSDSTGTEGGDDVETPAEPEADKDTPDTNVTPDEDESVPKTDSGSVDYEKDDRENAGDTTPSDDPSHAGYPWAEDKADSRVEDVVIDDEHTVKVPVHVDVEEGGKEPIEGGTSETDTWTGKGDQEDGWTEDRDGKDVDVDVKVDVTVSGDETTTNTTTSDALGVHDTTTVDGQETVNTTINRTETVENPDPVDKFDSSTDEIERDNDYKQIENETPAPENKPGEANNTGVNPSDPTVKVTVGADEENKKATSNTGTAKADVTDIVNKLKEEANQKKETTDGTTPIKDETGKEIGKKVVSTTVEDVMTGDKLTGVKTTVETVTEVTKPYKDVDPTKQNGLTDKEKNDAMEALLKEQYAAIEGLEGYEIKEHRDDNGKLTGYDLVKTVEKHDTATAQDVITLPERPLESVTVAENGEETRIEVTDRKDASGKTIGYVKVTTVTTPSGSVSTKTEVLSGTKTSNSTTSADSTHTIKTTVTGVTLNETGTMVTTTTKVTETQLKTVTASDRTVTVTLGVVEEDDGHGVTSVTGLKPTQAEPDVGKTSQKTGTNPNGTDLYHRADNEVAAQPGDYQFYFTGKYGLESAIRVNASDKSTGEQGNLSQTYQAHQFVLKGKDDTEHYVYCADFEVAPAKNGPHYDMENVTDASYYSGDDGKHILAIALNGYWGTSSGTGSMANFKSMLKEANGANGENKLGITNAAIDALTPGEALTATQAAIWHYGNSGNTAVNSNAVVGAYNKDKIIDYSNVNSNEKVQKIFEHLITMSQSPTEKTTLIEKDNFVRDATMTVGERNSDGTYKTDVTIGLKLAPSIKTDHTMQVEVYDKNGNKVASQEITSGSNSVTLSGVNLRADEDYTFKVTGKQEIAQSAYLFTAQTSNGASDHTISQTFVGVETGTRDVALKFALSFGVEASEAAISTENTKVTEEQDDYAFVIDAEHKTEDKTVTTIETETLRYWDSRTVETNTYEYGDDDDDDDDDDVRTGDDDDDDDVTTGDDDDDDVTVEEEPTPLVNAPTQETEDVTIEEDPVPQAAMPEEQEEVEIPEEDVPLAEVPATGDISAAWYAVTALAGCGLALLALRKKEQDA